LVRESDSWKKEKSHFLAGCVVLFDTFIFVENGGGGKKLVPKKSSIGGGEHSRVLFNKKKMSLEGEKKLLIDQRIEKGRPRL